MTARFTCKVALVVVEGIDQASIEHVVGNGSYVKGARYAQQHAVVHMEWDNAESALQGTVRGSGGHHYTTVVYFMSRHGSDLESARFIAPSAPYQCAAGQVPMYRFANFKGRDRDYIVGASAPADYGDYSEFLGCLWSP